MSLVDNDQIDRRMVHLHDCEGSGCHQGGRANRRKHPGGVVSTASPDRRFRVERDNASIDRARRRRLETSREAAPPDLEGGIGDGTLLPVEPDLPDDGADDCLDGGGQTAPPPAAVRLSRQQGGKQAA